MPNPDHVAFLRTVAVFKDLAEPHLVALALRLLERPLKKGEVLFREGDKEDDGNLDYGMLTELSNVTLVDAILDRGFALVTLSELLA